MVHIDAVDLIVDMNEEAARCVTERTPLHFSDEATRVADLVASQPAFLDLETGKMLHASQLLPAGPHSHLTNIICTGCVANLEVRDAPGL